MSALNRFLGDSPLRVAIKLIVISFLVGVAMSALGWTPLDLIDRMAAFLAGLWAMGFDAIYRFWGYFLLGAAIVIPVFLILRIINYRR